VVVDASVVAAVVVEAATVAVVAAAVAGGEVVTGAVVGGAVVSSPASPPQPAISRAVTRIAVRVLLMAAS